MKKTLLMASVAAFAGLGQIASAGSLSDPVIEQDLIIDDATSSSSGAATVLLLAVLLSIPVATD